MDPQDIISQYLDREGYREAKTSWFESYMSHRIKKIQPLLAVINGERGTGKSITAFAMAEKIVRLQREEIQFVQDDFGKVYDLRDAIFDETTIYFDTSPLPRDLGLPPNAPSYPGRGLPYGSVCVIDEPIGVGSDNWMGRLQRTITRSQIAGRISMKHLIINAPHFLQLMYSLREQLEPLKIQMWEPGVCTFYKLSSFFDRIRWKKLMQVGGRDPITGEVHRFPPPKNKRMIRNYYKEKDRRYQMLMENEEQAAAAYISPYSSPKEIEIKRRVAVATAK